LIKTTARVISRAVNRLPIRDGLCLAVHPPVGGWPRPIAADPQEGHDVTLHTHAT
jgi:hypothetical protein